MSKYYVVRQTEDGISFHEYGTVDQLKEGLWKKDVAPEYEPTFLDKCPDVMDGQFDSPHGARRFKETDTLVIKGEIIVPRPVKHVTEWEFK